MKLVKSLLLGSAAGLVAVAGASAADLGVKKPSAVQYVKTCPTYGAGFFVVPGTTACLKIVGRVRLDYIYENMRARPDNNQRFRSRGYVGWDHRVATEYGLLRTYVRAFFQRQSGHSTGPAGPTDSTTLEYAFIQFGGLTAGRVTPIFEHGWNQFYTYSGQNAIGYHSDIAYTTSIGYTANFGGGFSATIAIDDASERRVMTGGRTVPDLVASLGLNQSWGSLKLSGALFQVRSVVPTVDTKYGFAVEGAAKIKLDMLTKGSNLWFSAGFSQGSSSYNGMGGAFVIGNYTATITDAFVVGSSIKLSTTYALMGALQVYFTPTISASLGGTYAVYNPTGANNSIRTAAVLGQVAWTPVPGFLIGAEAAYRNIRFDGAATVAAISGTEKNDVIGRIRFQRDF